jgi:hypothetical protein
MHQRVRTLSAYLPAGLALLALVLAAGCSNNPSAKTNCGTAALQAHVGGKQTNLLSCAGVVIPTMSITVHPHDSIRITAPHGGTVPRLSTSSVVVQIDGDRITARQPGTALINETGWQCASGSPSCRLLQLVVS